MSLSEELFIIRYDEKHSISEQLKLVNELIHKSLSSESGYIGERAAKLFSDTPLKTRIVSDHIRFELNKQVKNTDIDMSFKADEALYLVSEFHNILDPVPLIKEIYKDQYVLLEKEMLFRIIGTVRFCLANNKDDLQDMKNYLMFKYFNLGLNSQLISAFSKIF